MRGPGERRMTWLERRQYERAAARAAAAPDPFPRGCTCLELEDSQRSADPDCPVHFETDSTDARTRKDSPS